MKSLPLTTILVSLLARHLHGSFGNFVEESYLMAMMDNGYTNMERLVHKAAKCQDCMINRAEVTVVSFDAITPFLAKFTIRASRLGFVRIQMYCNFNEQCSYLQRLRQRELGSSTPTSTMYNTNPTYLHECTELLTHLNSKLPCKNDKLTELMKGSTLYDTARPNDSLDNLLQSSDSSMLGQSNGKSLCIFQLHRLVTADCKICIRQTSGSKSIVEIQFVLNVEHYIVYLLRSSKHMEKILKDCSRCSFLQGELSRYHEYLCDETYTGVPRQEISEYPDMMCVQVTLTPSLFYSNDDMLQCMRYLAAADGNIAYWMAIGAVPSLPAYFLVSYAPMEFNNVGETQVQTCGSDRTIIEMSQIGNCFMNYYNQFEPSPPFETQISTHHPHPDTRFPPSTLTTSTVCLVAHYETKSRFKRSFKTGSMELSAHSSLIELQATSMAYPMHGILSIEFDKLVFIPQEMCVYERPKLASPKVINRADRKSNDATKPSSISSRGKSEFGSSHSPSNAKSFPTISGRDDAIVLVSLIPENPQCLACLALSNEVLLVSTVKNYVLMFASQHDDWHCGCEFVSFTQFDYVKTHKWRQLSSIEIVYHLDDPQFNKRIMGENVGLLLNELYPKKSNRYI